MSPLGTTPPFIDPPPPLPINTLISQIHPTWPHHGPFNASILQDMAYTLQQPQHSLHKRGEFGAFNPAFWANGLLMLIPLMSSFGLGEAQRRRLAHLEQEHRYHRHDPDIHRIGHSHRGYDSPYNPRKGGGDKKKNKKPDPEKAYGKFARRQLVDPVTKPHNSSVGEVWHGVPEEEDLWVAKTIISVEEVPDFPLDFISRMNVQIDSNTTAHLFCPDHPDNSTLTASIAGFKKPQNGLVTGDLHVPLPEHNASVTLTYLSLSSDADNRTTAAFHMLYDLLRLSHEAHKHQREHKHDIEHEVDELGFGKAVRDLINPVVGMLKRMLR